MIPPVLAVTIAAIFGVLVLALGLYQLQGRPVRLRSPGLSDLLIGLGIVAVSGYHLSHLLA